jgi:diguanylate cyclase (GGDEF)-like protein
MPAIRLTSLRISLLCLVAVAVLPAYVLLSYTALELRARSALEAIENARRLGGLLANEKRRVFREARELSQILSSIPGLANPDKRDYCSSFLSTIHKALPRYGNIGFASADGNIFCSAVPLSGLVNVADRAYFRRAVETRQFAVGDYLLGRVSGKPSLTVGLPLLDGAGNSQAVIFAALDLAWLNEALIQADLPEESEVRIIDRNGMLLAGYPDRHAIGTLLSDPMLAKAVSSLNASPAPDTRPEPATWVKDRRTNVVYPVGDDLNQQVYLWTEVSRTPAIAEIERYFLRYLLWIAVATLLVFALAWIMGNQLVIKTVNAVADAARRFAEGDLSARTGLKRAPAEIINLASTFDLMAEGVAAREKKISEISSELSRSNRLLRTLSRCNRTLLRAENERQLLEDMCRVATETGGFRAAWVGYRQNDDLQSILPMAFSGLPKEFFEALDISWGDNEKGFGVCARSIRSGEIVTAEHLLSEPGSKPWWELLASHGIKAAVAAPLRVNKDVIGILAIYASESDAFTGKDVELLDELAADLSFGIETIRARAEHKKTEEALNHLAMHDPSTGLPNQIRLRQWLESEIKTARKTRDSIALLCFDFPRLREISDVLGPRSVNQCIALIAREIAEASGKGAFVAREGRFTIALASPGLDLHGATQLAEKMQATLSKPFDLGTHSIQIESWIGIAIFPGQAADPDALVGRASLAAQRALSTGRSHAIIESNPEEATLKRLTLLAELQNAIDNSDLIVHFQPKIEGNS